MNIKTFKGNFFEIGKQQGLIMKNNGMKLDKVMVNEKIIGEQLKIYQKYYPERIEELQGISEGGGFNKEKVFQIYLAGELMQFSKGIRKPLACTIFGIKNKNGVFVGRNLDWLPVTEKIMEVYKQEAIGKFKLLAVSDMFIGSEEDVQGKFLFYDAIDVINEKGLFIGITFAYGDNCSYGFSWKEITKYIGENCATLKEALAVFKNFPVGIPKNFFIADKNGEMAVVEHNVSEYKVLYPKDDVLIHTNHYLDPDLAKKDRVLVELPYHNTFIRYYEALQKINFVKDNFDLSNVIKILGDPRYYLCQNHEIRTIWTLALDMTNKKYNIYWDILGKRKTKELEI